MKMKIFFLAICLSLFTASAFAQVQDVQADVKPDSCTVGDDLIYTLTVWHTAGTRVAYPTAKDTVFSPFEIRSVRKISEESKGSATVVEKMEYKLAVFDTGQQTIPPVPIAFADSAHLADARTLSAPTKSVYVKSVLSESKKDVTDIKPLLSLPVPLWVYFAIAAGVLILGLVIYFGWKYYQKRKAIPTAPKPVPSKSPYEVAAEKLKALQNKSLTTPESYKEFYTELSDITREFIETYFRIRAKEEITSEILRDMTAGEIPALQVERVRGILEKADLVKFAKYFPSSLEARESVRTALDVIEVAKPTLQADAKKTEPTETIKP
jgi:hypothetical protein